MLECSCGSVGRVATGEVTLGWDLSEVRERAMQTPEDNFPKRGNSECKRE